MPNSTDLAVILGRWEFDKTMSAKAKNYRQICQERRDLFWSASSTNTQNFIDKISTNKIIFQSEHQRVPTVREQLKR